MSTQRVVVLGEGAWGIALALSLVDYAQSITLWCHDTHVAHELRTQHTNRRYLPGIVIDDRIIVATDIIDAVTHADTVVITTPVLYLKNTLAPIAKLLCTKEIILGCKGLESTTTDTPAEMVRTLCNAPDMPIVTLAGASFARELIAGVPTNLVVASTNSTARAHALSLLRAPHIVCEESDDEIGVALCAALKNVYAIGGGILTALGAGENSMAFYCVAVLREMRTLLRAAHCSDDTLLSSAGVGDLILTSLTLESKNRTYGYLRGNGKPHAAWEESGRPYPEGVNTLAALEALQKRYAVKLPIAQTLYEITYKSTPPEELFNVLLGQR